MIIKKIDWIDENIKEAEVTVTDGTYEIICFCHPCDYKEGDEVKEVLNCFNTGLVYISEEECLVQKQTPPWDYWIVAKVIDSKSNLAAVGDIMMNVDIPKDINNGEFIEFNCTRFDL